VTGVRVRPAAVAGTFYPADRASLTRDIDSFLTHAAGTSPGPAAKVLVVPHAGYVYSGPVAAHAYARTERLRGVVERVVLFGPSHRVAVRGLAISSADAFDTPLGRVVIDDEARRAALTLPQVHVDDAAHRAEHSLEVQLPFLQRTLGRFELVPFAVGNATAGEVAEVAELLWGGPETLLVVSSDLSHYHPYEDARLRDTATAQAVVEGDIDSIDGHDACGAVPLRGLMAAARDFGLRTSLLDLRNSGDTAGPRDRVVGYAAFEMAETQ